MARKKKLKIKLNSSTYIIIILAVFFNIAFYAYVYRALVSLTDQLLVKAVGSGTDSVESLIRQKSIEVEILSDFDVLSDESVDNETKINILNSYKNKNEMLRIFLSDTNGNAVSNYGETLNFKSYDFFNKALQGKTSMSEPIYSYHTRAWVTAAAAPIHNQKGAINGVVVAYYDLKELGDIIKNIDIGDDTVAFITNTDGIIVVGNAEEVTKAVTSAGTIPKNKEGFQSLRNLQFRAIELLNGTGEYVYNDVKKYSVFRTIPNSDWILVVSIPTNNIYKGINYLAYNITVVTLVILFVGVYFSLRSDRLGKTLEDEKNKMGLIIDNADMFSITLDATNRIIQANRNFLRNTGYTKHEFASITVYNIIPENYKKDYSTIINKIVNDEKVTELDLPIITKDGTILYIMWNCNNISVQNPKMFTIELVGTNITGIKEYENKIQRLAYFDQLTGLNNVTFLSEYANSYMASGTKGRMAFVYLDIDNFKYINDMFGHDVGDNFIVDVCNRVVSIDNPKVKVSRHGGDELAIIYQDLGTDAELKEYLNSLVMELKKEYYINNIKMTISASIGISFYPDDGNSYGELFKAADIAMNRAKELGKDRIQFFTNEMKNDIYEIIMIESELRSAIENNEFVLYYQPQFEIESGRLCGFEALIRWVNPRRGFVPPNKFIPQAEKNQLIIPIGEWVLEMACDFLNEILGAGYKDIEISVNVSVVQLMCENYVEKVMDILDRKKINPSNIKLEITESVMMESIEDIMQKIGTLSNKGIFFSLDDFGTGYSSLTYLKKIPIKVLKIDKSFVDTISEKDGDREILSSIIGLAHKINLDVIAEGIEELQQLEWLKDKGCNVGQGFFMGKPMPKEAAIKELGRNIYT